MHYWGTALGTLLLSSICVAILYFFSVSKANLNSHIPLPLRAFIAASMMSWVFYVGVWGQMLPLPALYFFYLYQNDYFQNIAIKSDDLIVFYFALFDFVLKLALFLIFTLFKIGKLGRGAPKTKFTTSFAWYGIFILTASALLFFKAYALPCKFEINGVCYDKPKKENPPINFDIQMIDADTKMPLENGWIAIDWHSPDVNGQLQCVQQDYGQTDAQGRFHMTGKDGSWMYGRVIIFAPGYEPLNYIEWDDHPNVLTAAIEIGDSQRGEFPAWEAQALALGYKANIIPNQYTKFYPKPAPAIYNRLNIRPHMPTGQIQLWVTSRSLPTRVRGELVYMGSACRNIQSQSHLTEKKWRRAYSEKAMKILCDEKWDSIQPNTVATTREYIQSAANVIENPETQIDMLKRTLPAFFNIDHSYYRPMSDIERSAAQQLERRPLTSAERTSFCAAIQPFFAVPIR